MDTAKADFETRESLWQAERQNLLAQVDFVKTAEAMIKFMADMEAECGVKRAKKDT